MITVSIDIQSHTQKNYELWDDALGYDTVMGGEGSACLKWDVEDQRSR